MHTKFTSQVRKTLYGIMLLGLTILLCGAGSLPAVRAQAAEMETPTLVPQESGIPLYDGLTWSIVSNYTQELNIPGFQQTVTLDGYLYKSSPFATQGKPPSEFLDFYSPERMILWGWTSIGYQDNPGSIGITYYEKVNKRFLDVTIEECGSDIANSIYSIANPFCAKLWISPNGVFYEPIIPIPEKKPNNGLPGASVNALSFSNPLPVPFLSQRNSDPNSNITLGWGSSPVTIHGYGCALTSYAMIYNYYQPNFTTVIDLNDSMKVAPGTYSCSGGACNLWPSPNANAPDAPSGVSSRLRYTNDCSTVSCIDNTSSHPYIALIDNELNSGRPMHLRVHPSGGTFNSHSIVLIGHVGNDYIIMDPWATDDQQRTLATGALGGYVVDYIDTIVGTPVGDTTPPEEAYIDGPSEGAVIRDNLNVDGWAVDHGSGMQRVEIWLDNVYQGNASYGIYRADLGGNVGYHWDANSTQYGDGNHTLLVRFYDQAGNYKDGTRSIVVNNIYRVSWLNDNTPTILVTDTIYNVTMQIQNIGTIEWPYAGETPVHLAYHWLDSGGNTVVFDGARTNLPYNIPVSGVVPPLSAVLQSPSQAGDYILRWDMVQEGVTWFSEKGAPTRDISIHVNQYIPPTPTRTPTRTPTVTATKTTTFTPTSTPTKTPAVITLQSTGSYDGWVLESSETSNVGGSINSSATTFYLGDNATKKQYRGILSFNTGSLPDNAVITGVTLKVRQQAIVGGGNPVSIFGGFMFDVRNGFFGTAATLQSGDFQALANRSYGPSAPAPVGGWYSFNLTSAKPFVNKLATGSGLTQIRLRFKLDDNNNAIANVLSLYSGNAPTADRPQLVITYYVP